jgi:polyhydroxyalkanoate synthesis regulator phasin
MKLSSLLRKSTLIGLGVASLSKKKADKLVKQLTKHGHVSEKEGRKLAKDLLNESKKHAKRLQNLIEKEVKKALKTGRKSSRK